MHAKYKCIRRAMIALFISVNIPALAQEHDATREESAHHIIYQAQEFKRQAAAYHEAVKVQSKEATILLAQSKKLESSSKKLRAGIKENATLTHPFSLDANQYNLHLNEFHNHSKLYNAHLADYEKELLKAQAAEGQLKSSCQEFADHVQKFHIPGVRPPHVCVQMQWESKDMQKAARGFVNDQSKSQQTELALAKQESKLADAAHERAALEAKLLQKANIDELERTQGAMLLKEYQQIEREFRMLQQEKQSLPKK